MSIFDLISELSWNWRDNQHVAITAISLSEDNRLCIRDENGLFITTLPLVAPGLEHGTNNSVNILKAP